MRLSNPIAVCALLLLAATCSPSRESSDWSVTDEVNLFTDRRVARVEIWEEMLEKASTADERIAVARGAGQVRDPRLEPFLAAWLARETDANVRAEQIFALGQIGDPAAIPVLQDQLTADEPLLRARAAGALAKLGDDSVVIALLPLLDDPDAGVRGAGLLAMARLRGRRAAPEEPLPPVLSAHLRDDAARLLDDSDEGVRWRAAYALAEIDLPERFPLLAGASESDEDLVRLFAIRGLGRLSGDEDARLAILAATVAGDPDPHVAAAAGEALAGLGRREAVEPLLSAAVEVSGPADHHRRQAAVRALGLLAPDSGLLPRVTQVLRAALDDPSPAVRMAALAALARLAPDEASPLVEVRARLDDRVARQAAAAACQHLDTARAMPLLHELVRDPEPRVSSAALQALAAREETATETRTEALDRLAVDDLAVRATALAIVGTHGEEADLEPVARAYDASQGFEWVEARIEALRTAGAIGGPRAAELLKAGLKDPSPAVRQVAARSLAELLGTAPPDPPLEGPPSGVVLDPGGELAGGDSRPRVRLHTVRGVIEIELYRDEAPRHVRSFLDQARSGVYSGLPFHRVVSGFVVQGLDPRGDGWGTGGIFLRDEINPVPYLAGTVGMPNAGPDTGGCQIFITHVPTPHLDGGYTVFGRVVEGMAVLDALDLGDRCRRVEILE